MITIQNASAALKDYYLEAVTAQLNENVSPFFSAIEKTAANVSGKDVKFTIVRGGMTSVVAGDESGDLPTPYSNKYYNISLPLKNIFGTIEISDKAIRASRDSSGAFVNLLNTEMEGLICSAKANFSRMLFGDGNGTIAIVKSKAESGNVIYLNDVKKYFSGLTVDILNGSTKVVTGAKISTVDMEAKSITVNVSLSSVTLAEGYKVAVSGVYGKEMIGLSGIFDGTTLYSYSKTGEVFFAPAIKTVSTLTEDDLVDFIDELEAQQDSKVNMILCSHASRKKIASLMSDSRRVVNTADIAAGYSSVIVNDVPVYADKYCPDDRIYLLNTADFTLNQLCDWEWLEDEDGKIIRQVPGKAAFSATLVKYAELICTKPCGQGLIKLS